MALWWNCMQHSFAAIPLQLKISWTLQMKTQSNVRLVNIKLLLIYYVLCTCYVCSTGLESVPWKIYCQLAPVLPLLPWPTHNPPATAAATAECHRCAMWHCCTERGTKCLQFNSIREDWCKLEAMQHCRYGIYGSFIYGSKRAQF